MNAYGMVLTRGSGFKFRGAVEGIAYGAQRFALADVTARRIEPKHPQNDPIRAGFEGVIMSLEHHTAFMGRTVIRRDMGMLNPRSVDGMKRVGLVSSHFEKTFEVYSDDQVEARTLLTPDFMERLMVFNEDYLGRGVQIMFLGGQIHLALDIDERFNFTRDTPAFDYRDACAVILLEIGAIFALLEAVQAVEARIGRAGDSGADKARNGYYRELMGILRKMLKDEEAHWKPKQALPDGMRDSHYLFCDGLKGLLYPRI